MRLRLKTFHHGLILLCSFWFGLSGVAGDPGPSGWFQIDYQELVNGRQLTHSGEPLATVLNRLKGRAWSEARTDRQVRIDHQLIDPWMEPFAFVLSDVTDAQGPLPEKPWVEVGSLWHSGEAQPAWVELLRARKYVVQANGDGDFRLFLPYQEDVLFSSQGLPIAQDQKAGESAWASARSVVRHALLATQTTTEAEDLKNTLINLKIYPFVHRPERAQFLLGKNPFQVSLSIESLLASERPRFPKADWTAAVQAGPLEGLRLQKDGSLEFWNAHGQPASTLLDSPLSPGDLAVAWRAVRHGGRVEPYMSLDRASSPWKSIVNYGGRLKDTRLGWVSLLSDIRFKTFSNGLGFFEGEDLRSSVRELLPSFSTHMERLASDPSAEQIRGQQTRLWFYPDAVDLTISPNLDLLALRTVRMSAASERMAFADQMAATLETPPWTQQTIDQINREYDVLAKPFEELKDLDEVVRLLSIATWLQAAGEAGLLIPDMDALLNETLPAVPTPREFPQLLAFHALPPTAASDGEVWALDRVQLAERLGRLDPPAGEQPSAIRMFYEERNMLDPSDQAHSRLLTEIEALTPESMRPELLDYETYRARRLWMHRNVLRSLSEAEQVQLLEESKVAGVPRLFSLGIGGIDLGMNQALARAKATASEQSLSLLGSDRTSSNAIPSVKQTTTSHTNMASKNSSDHRSDLAHYQNLVPDFNAPSTRTSFARISRSQGNQTVLFAEENYFPDSPEARRRVMQLNDQGVPQIFARQEGSNAWSYRLTQQQDRVRVTTGAALSWRDLPAVRPIETWPEDLLGLTLRVRSLDQGGGAALDLVRGAASAQTSEWPSRLLKKMVAGPDAWPLVDRSLPGWEPLPPAFRDATAVAVRSNVADGTTPWDAQRNRSGEQVPARLARGLGEWLELPVVVFTEGKRSLDRWQAGSKIPKKVTLVLPEEGFPYPHGALRERLAQTWKLGPVLSSVPERVSGPLLYVAAEPSGWTSERLNKINTSEKAQPLLIWNLIETPAEDRIRHLLQRGWNSIAVAEGGVTATRDAADALVKFQQRVKQSKGDPWYAIKDSWLWFY